MDYAQNLYQTEIKKYILDLLLLYSAPEQSAQSAQSEQEHLSLWFLLDGVMLKSGDLGVLASSARQSRAILSKTQYTIDDDDFGPWLMQAPDEQSAQEQWLEKLIESCTGLPALNIIVTEHTADEIENTLATLITVSTTDKQSFYCRFADTRIIPVLIQALSVQQKEAAFATIKHWYFVNRSGYMEQAFSREDKQYASVFYTPLRLMLNEPQFVFMLEASEPDNIFSLLCELSPELVPEKKRGDFHVKLKRILAMAQTKQIIDIQDQLQFTMLALSFGEGFHQHEILQDTWEKLNAQTDKLGNLIAGWPDDIWQALEVIQQPGGAKSA